MIANIKWKIFHSSFCTLHSAFIILSQTSLLQLLILLKSQELAAVKFAGFVLQQKRKEWCCSQLGLLLHQFQDLFFQARQVSYDCAPNNFIIYRVVAMNYPVPHSYY